MILFARQVLRPWAPAALAIALTAAAGVHLANEQWRNELEAADARTRAVTSQLGGSVAAVLARGQYEALPDLLRDWARTDPSIARLRLVARNGLVLAEDARPDLHGLQIVRTVALPYGLRGEARLTVVTDLGLAERRQANLRVELAVAGMILAAASIATTLLLRALHASSRRYRLLLATNAPLLAPAGAPDLLQAVCDAATREGGYVLASIELRAGTPFLRNAASAGPAVGFLQQTVAAGDQATPMEAWPVGPVLRAGTPLVCDDILRDRTLAAWATAARRHGVRSAISVPLVRGSEVAGVLSVFSAERYRFDPAERALITQMAADISLGIGYAARGAELEQTLQQLREIESSVGAGAFALSLPERRLWCSAGAAALLGRAAGDALVPESTAAGKRDVAADLADLVTAAADTGGAYDFDLPMQPGDGPPRWLRATGVVTRHDDDGGSARGMLQDISDRKALEVELAIAADHERRRLAAELHDNLGQVLTGATLLLSAMERNAAAGAAPSVSDVQRVRGPVQESLRLCRALAHDAAPNLRGGIGDSLEALATMATAAGVRCQLSVDPGTASLAGEQALELYRIAQEAVTNALKHGKCQEINVRLAQRGPAIELTISDDGIGFRDDGTPPVAGLGFRTMRYRAARAGGSVVFRANADRGVTVHVRVPRLAA